MQTTKIHTDSSKTTSDQLHLQDQSMVDTLTLETQDQSIVDTLTLEIFFEIFSFLSPEMALTAATVCKYFHMIINDNIFWQRKFARQYPHQVKLCLANETKNKTPHTNEKEEGKSINWLQSFIQYHEIENIPFFRTHDKQSALDCVKILSWIKEGDSESLQAKFSDIGLGIFDEKDNQEKSLLDWAEEVGSQAVLNYIYKIAKAHYSPQQTIDVTMTDKHGRTILFWAMHQPPKKVLKLLSLGCRVDEQYKEFFQAAGSKIIYLHPIHVAVKKGRLEIVQLLIQKSPALLEQVDNYGRTPLLLAAFYGHLKMVDYLIERKANIHAKMTTVLMSNTDTDKTPLYWAAERGHAKIVDRLVKAGAHCAIAAGDMQYQPIHMAAKNGHLDVVKVLSEKPELIDQADQYHQTALLWAAVEGHTDVVDYLLNKRAQYEVFSNLSNHHHPDHGRTPLHWAARTGHANVVKLLIRAGAMATTTIGEFQTQPIHTAVMECHLGVVKILIDKKPELLEQVDSFNQTPLFLAIQACFGYRCAGYVEIAKYLLEKKANPNVVSHHPERHTINGWTPLHWAAVRSQVDILKQLIKANASPDALNHQGETAVDVAVHGEVKDTLQLFIYTKKLKQDPQFALTFFKNKEQTIAPSQETPSQEKIKLALKALKNLALGKTQPESLDDHQEILKDSILEPICQRLKKQ